MIHRKPRYAKSSKCSWCEIPLILSNMRAHKHFCDACHKELVATTLASPSSQEATKKSKKERSSKKVRSTHRFTLDFESVLSMLREDELEQVLRALRELEE